MDKLKKIVFEVINLKTEGVDTYHNNGSMWLIFTDKKKWVIELTKQGTLWYNYIFFQDCFKYLSLGVIENQHYITEWVEGILQNGVGHTSPTGEWESVRVEDTIQNRGRSTYTLIKVEDTIQNGVKETKHQCLEGDLAMEEVLQNGVKETDFYAGNLLYDVEYTIQNGLKHTEPGGYLGPIEMKGKIVHQLESPKQNEEVEDVIENGVRNTDWRALPMTRSVEDTIQNGVKNTVSYKNRPQPTVEGVIQNGIKETKQEPSQRTWKINEVIKETKTPGDGDLLSTIEWMESNNTESVPEMIQDVITNSIKNTQPHVLEILNPIAFEPTLKENKRMNEVNNVLEKSIKEVIELPDQSGELNGYGEYYARQKNRAYPHTDTVNDVIRDGIKETYADAYHYIPTVEGVITNNVKETNWRRVDNFPEFEERVIKGGKKL